MNGRPTRSSGSLDASALFKKKEKKEWVGGQPKKTTKKRNNQIRSPDNASWQAGINSPCLPHQGWFGTVDNLIAFKPPLSNAETSFWIIYFY